MKSSNSTLIRKMAHLPPLPPPPPPLPPTVSPTYGAPLPVVMAREIPIAVAVRMVWQPLDWTIENQYQNQTEERKKIDNAQWSLPSANWSTLGERLNMFLQTWCPEKANERTVISLIVSHFGKHFASKRFPNAEMERSIQRTLQRRYVTSTRFQKLCAPPSCGGDYDSGTQGICEWWTKTLLLFVLILLIIAFTLLSMSSEMTKQSILKQTAESTQMIEVMEACGWFSVVIASLACLPALWILFIQTVRGCACCLSSLCCCQTDLWYGCCDCCDWLPCCCCRHRQRNVQVQPSSIDTTTAVFSAEHAGNAVEMEHVRRRRERAAAFRAKSEWNKYSNDSSFFELQIYVIYCCIVTEIPVACLRGLCECTQLCLHCCMKGCGRITDQFFHNCCNKGGDQCVQCCQCFGECVAECGSCIGKCDLGAMDCAC